MVEKCNEVVRETQNVPKIVFKNLNIMVIDS